MSSFSWLLYSIIEIPLDPKISLGVVHLLLWHVVVVVSSLLLFQVLLFFLASPCLKSPLLTTT
jgi:hypothetical protein